MDDAAGGSAPKVIPINNQLAPYGRMLVYFSGINTASADEVRLLDPSGKVVDSHSNFYAGSSIAGKCYGRRPSGGAWAAGPLASCSPAGNNP